MAGSDGLISYSEWEGLLANHSLIGHWIFNGVWDKMMKDTENRGGIDYMHFLETLAIASTDEYNVGKIKEVEEKTPDGPQDRCLVYRELT